VNERHLKRLVHEHVRYYHDDCAHLALSEGTAYPTPSQNTLGAFLEWIAPEFKVGEEQTTNSRPPLS
jgi:hypothetical protein